MTATKRDLTTTGAPPDPVSRVLVVDDSRLQRRILTSVMEKLGYAVWQAECGSEALALAEEIVPDLILSDWMMPGMDGLEFCRRFRELDRDSYGYFILLTSKSDKDEIAAGLDAGADDFLTKPVNGDELRARISAGARILSMQQELSEKNRVISDTLAELQGLYDAIDSDLQQARKIQQSLVPERVGEFGRSRVSLLLKPCGHVGGDLVGMFSPRAGKLGFYNIDVSGHGITSAMMTARVAGHLSGAYLDENLAVSRDGDARFALRPACEVGGILNDRLSADPGIAEYLTMAYAAVDLDTGRAEILQAGHPHPLILRADGKAEFVGDGGVPIGLVEGACYGTIEVQLHPGDRLLFYSDGFTEATMKHGGMLEEDGFLGLVRDALAAETGAEFLDELYWRLSQDMAPAGGSEDDLSAALLEYGGPG